MKHHEYLKELALSFLLSSQVFAFGQVQSRNIVAYQPIEIQSPVGTVPRLPHQVRVTYSDGSIALRQVRWENAALAIEQEQADSLSHPVGKHYTIKGYITGDETTAAGYPVQADITICEGTYATPHHKPIAETLPLDKVTINGDNRLTSNRDMAIREILYKARDLVIIA